MTESKSSGRRVLVVDDHGAAPLLNHALLAAAFLVTHVDSVEQAVFELEHGDYCAAFVELSLRAGNGHDILLRAAAIHNPPVVIMMSTCPEVAAVVTAMRAGATDFLEKPLNAGTLIERLERALLHAIEQRRLFAHGDNSLPPVAAPRRATSAMHDTLLLVDKVAATPSSGAFLVGESGSGKEVIAARIHGRSSRRGGPFVRVNVAAIPSSMFEAELFGSVRGAFTDAKANRAGYLASADGGTILLDEIGELRLDDQPKLLRVLEERRFFPIGSDQQRSVDVRVIAATNRDPQVMLDEGRLRPDLFYRLGTVIKVPPLRERTDEILPLAELFVPLFCLDFGRSLCRLTPAAATLLQSYSWPGNVRELRNAIERAIMLTEGDDIQAESFDLVRQRVSPPGSGERVALHRLCRDSSEAIEREQIMTALASAGSSRSQAARILGVSRSTLYERLKRYNLL